LKGSKRYFLRFLFQILFIAVVVPGIILSVLLLVTVKNSKDWPRYIAKDYVEGIRGSLPERFPADMLLSTMLSHANDRVSGLSFRNSDNDFIFIYGNAPEGWGFGKSQKNAERLQDATERDFNQPIDFGEEHTFSSSVPVYVFDLKPNMYTGIYGYSFYDNGIERLRYRVPKEIKKPDVAATIIIKENGITKGYVDILVMRPSAYGPTKFLLDAYFSITGISVLFAFIISISGSLAFSLKNNKTVTDIKDALKRLSANDYGKSKITRFGVEELDEIASSIETLGENLSRNQESRKEWIRSISHDLNTPLTGINMLVDGAMDGVFPLDGKLLENIKKEADNLSGKIAAVRYYAYLVGPDAKLNIGDAEAGEIIENASSISAFGNYTIKGDVKTKFSVDVNMASRALSELLSNASEAGGKDVAIEVADGRISVYNSGRLPSPLPDFFEPWSRGDQSRHQGGSGMGLPIVSEIMKLHKGKATISEKDGVVETTLDFTQRT